MLYLIIAALTIALVLAWLRLREAKREALRVETALREQRSFSHDDTIHGPGGPAWNALRAATNALLAEQAQLRQTGSGQLAQIEATLGALQEAVLLVDSENRVLLANPALQAIFPRARDILDQRLETVLHSVAFLKLVDAIRAGNAPPQQELEFVEGNGSVWLEVTGTPVAPFDGGSSTWVLFVLHNITRQKQLEGIRKDFVANVSHELRTPLSIIKGYIETLVDSHREMPTEDRERFLRTIQRHTERLNSLLEDLLALSRLESIHPGLRRESTELAELLGNLIEDLRGRAAARDHTVSAFIDPAIGRVLVDPLKITQVCENLIDNALKYTPRGSRIDLSAHLRAGEVEISVRDNGPGIPAADLPHLFERFYRVDKGRSREKGGTGLGLSIVKHIVQLHGGRVWVESEQGKGTAFFFTLPERSASEPSPQPAESKAAAWPV
jgi:two-component system, OmpR family, phosphate regulon sensor histidine kinase PhoR